MPAHSVVQVASTEPTHPTIFTASVEKVPATSVATPSTTFRASTHGPGGDGDGGGGGWAQAAVPEQEVANWQHPFLKSASVRFTLPKFWLSSVLRCP
jgi:hypothetical protein